MEIYIKKTLTDEETKKYLIIEDIKNWFTELQTNHLDTLTLEELQAVYDEQNGVIISIPINVDLIKK